MRYSTVAGGAISLVIAVLLLSQTSMAAFTATTTNGTNSWAAGSVALTDDDSGSLMFNETGLVPNDSGENCITVTYNGNVNSDVRVYASSSGTLATYLNVTIERGTGGGFGNCTGFSASETLYSSSALASLAATNFATGLGTFAPTGSGQTTTYRIAWSVADNNLAQGQTATADFTWEAQSS